MGMENKVGSEQEYIAGKGVDSAEGLGTCFSILITKLEREV